MNLYIKVLALLSVIVASITLTSFYDINDKNIIQTDGDNLECGFTDDFKQFLAQKGNFHILFRIFYISI
jgi:hypothetical protein